MEKIIFNPDSLSAKIEKFKKDGLDALHVVSDFDRSFTKCFVGGKRSSTSWAQFRNLGIFDEDYLKRSSEMFEHYRPIEISYDIGEDEKQEKMKEWWERHRDLLIEKGISKETIDEVVGRGGIVLRDGAKGALEFLNQKKIPLVFISSGLGDLIEGVLKKEGVLFGNIEIVSNFFRFDDKGKAVSFQNASQGKPIINSHNKNEASIKNLDLIAGRKNVILVGDAIEDLKILEGASHDEIITIGFLNEDVEKNIDLFKEGFDVVITGDGDMGFLLKLLEDIKD